MAQAAEPPPPSPEKHAGDDSIAARILRASAVILAAHLCFKLIGLVQYKVIGFYCDKVTRDLFVFGYEHVLGLFFLIGEEALGPALLPVFMEEKDKRDEAAAWRFAGTVVTIQFLLISVVVLAIASHPEAVVRWLTEWDEPDALPVYMRYAPDFARWMIFGLFGMSLGSATYMLLNGYKRFFLAAFGDASLKAGIVAVLAGSVAAGWNLNTQNSLKILAGGVVLGSVLKLATHLAGLRREIRLFRPNLSWSSPAFRKFTLLVLPLLLGIVFAKARDWYNHAYVITTVQEAGLMAANAWGRKIFQTLGWLAPYAVSIAMLPFFCEMVDRDKKDELGATVTTSSRLLLMLMTPVAVLVAVLSLPIAQVLFQGGQFSFADCRLAATANACYVLVLPAYALEYIFMQTFFSNRRMISVTVIGLVFSTLAMALAYLTVVSWQWRGAMALVGVAGAFTVSRTIKAFVLGVAMRRFLPCFPVAETVSFLIRVIAVSAAAGAAAWGVRHVYERFVPLESATSQWQALRVAGPELVLAGGAGAVTAAAGLWLLCRQDTTLVIAWTLEKLRRRRGKT